VDYFDDCVCVMMRESVCGFIDDCVCVCDDESVRIILMIVCL